MRNETHKGKYILYGFIFIVHFMSGSTIIVGMILWANTHDIFSVAALCVGMVLIYSLLLYLLLQTLLQRISKAKSDSKSTGIEILKKLNYYRQKRIK